MLQMNDMTGSSRTVEVDEEVETPDIEGELNLHQESNEEAFNSHPGIEYEVEEDDEECECIYMGNLFYIFC